VARDDDAHARVDGVLSDRFTRDALDVEQQAVLGARDSGDLPQDCDEAVHVRAALSEEVEVLRRAVRLAEPLREQRRALEHERLRVGGDRQAVEQPLDRVPDQEALEVLPVAPRAVQEAGANRGTVVLPCHDMASR
jgi:hypothetical protein